MVVLQGVASVHALWGVVRIRDATANTQSTLVPPGSSFHPLFNFINH